MDTRIAAALLLLLLGTGTARATGYEALGREFAAAARAAGVTRVSLGRVAGPPASRAAAERLLAALVSQEGLQVVEREQIPELMAERALARSGAAEGPGPERRLAASQAVVLARYEEPGVLSARLVAVETGVILAAGRAEEASAAPAPAPPAFPRNLPIVEPALLPRAGQSAPLDCADAAERAERLEEEVLELKARYWAWVERKRGLDPRANPEEGIRDPLQLALFRARRAHWRESRRIPPLDREEVRRFVDADGRAFALRRACGSGRDVARR